MRISDWSSDVCSSDLSRVGQPNEPSRCHRCLYDVLFPIYGILRNRLELRNTTDFPRGSRLRRGGNRRTVAIDHRGPLSARTAYTRAFDLQCCEQARRLRCVRRRWLVCSVVWVDRKSVVEGKSVFVSVALGGRRIL